MTQSPEAVAWNKEFAKNRRYEGEPPVEFVSQIIDELGESGRTATGLYVGCGNGRNYLPLRDGGLDRLRGVDISDAAIQQLIETSPEVAKDVYVGDWYQTRTARIYDYIVALQIFQHGSEAKANQYFQIASNALKPQGLLFLRVNSVATHIYHKNHEVERNKQGGFTVIYDEGPKTGLPIHFFTKPELKKIAHKNRFAIKSPLVEVAELRKPPQTGTWTQWETVWQKT